MAKEKDHRGAGKGDRYRPVDRKKFDAGHDRIFGNARKDNKKRKKPVK